MMNIFKRIKNLEQAKEDLEWENVKIRSRLTELESKTIYDKMSKQELYNNFKYLQFNQLEPGARLTIREKFDLFIVNNHKDVWARDKKHVVFGWNTFGLIVDELNLLVNDES